MGLQDLSAETIGYTFFGLAMLAYFDRLAYNISKDNLLNLKEIFGNAEFYSEHMHPYISRENLSDKELKVFELNKQHAIERYEFLLKEKIPVFFTVIRPFFYFRTKKELNSMKKESKERLKELVESA